MLSETAARWLLVLHTALGVSAVASATHLVIWLRRYVRGQQSKRRSVIRFAWLVLALQLGAFAAGNLMYPTYKVEVRTAYLESASAITADQATRTKELQIAAAREGARAPVPGATADIVRRAASAARWFDIKEHWIALGILGSLALVLVLAYWDPGAGRALAPAVLGLAVIVAATLWLGAVIGIATASWRAV